MLSILVVWSFLFVVKGSVESAAVDIISFIVVVGFGVFVGPLSVTESIFVSALVGALDTFVGALAFSLSVDVLSGEGTAIELDLDASTMPQTVFIVSFKARSGGTGIVACAVFEVVFIVACIETAIDTIVASLAVFDRFGDLFAIFERGRLEDITDIKSTSFVESQDTVGLGRDFVFSEEEREFKSIEGDEEGIFVIASGAGMGTKEDGIVFFDLKGVTGDTDGVDGRGKFAFEAGEVVDGLDRGHDTSEG